MSWLGTLEPHWFWLILAAILASLEIIIPGVFLIWFAAAAAITGVAAFMLPISATVQGVIFAILSVIAVYAGRRWFARNPILSADPLLNDRGARLVGELVSVVEPITNGRGRVKVGDSVWSARGADAAIGESVKVIGADGSVLLVELV